MDHAAIASAHDEIADRWLDDRLDQANGIPPHARAPAFLRNVADGWEDTHVDSSMGPEVCYSTLGIPGLLDAIAEAGCKGLMNIYELCDAQRQSG